MLQGIRPETRAALNDPMLGGAIAALALMLLAAGLIVKKRVAPE